MDRHKKAGPDNGQPAQEVQLHQRLNDSTPLEAALAYAARGWPVLPLHSVREAARAVSPTAAALASIPAPSMA
jgi:hypothetical protein